MMGIYAHLLPEPSWEEQFDACVRRLKEIDREEAEMRRRFIHDMRGLLDQAEEAL